MNTNQKLAQLNLLRVTLWELLQSEAIYSLIMMKNNFIAASANINEMDEEAKKYPIVTKV